jgi:hypothetical protein
MPEHVRQQLTEFKRKHSMIRDFEAEAEREAIQGEAE